MKKFIPLKIFNPLKPKFLNLAFSFLLSPFCFLPCSAQSYTVYSCDFENWTDGKPDGWEIIGHSLYPATVFQYTPAYSGLYSCKAEGKVALQMNTTETFPIYWGKKYILSFTAKMIQDAKFRIRIGNRQPDSYYNVLYFSQEFEINSEWNNYEIEFISQSMMVGGGNQLPASTLGNTLSILITSGYSFDPGDIEFIIDRIKLVAVDHTMEFDYLDANNLKTYVDPIASIYNSTGTSNSINFFEAPKGSGKSTLFNTNIWMGGWSQPSSGGIPQGNLHLAAHRFYQHGRDFWIGPITNDYEIIDNEKVVSEDYIQKYYHTWKVTKAEIAYHKAHYADPGYEMPWGIAHWPAHGRTEFGESANLAPYVSVSGDNTYIPWLGDYPKIRGDQAVFFITNDMEAPHTESGCPNNLGVEILGMAYSFSSPNPALDNTIFFSYELKNKSTTTYYDFYFGYFVDFDLGYPWDDYVGCDTLQNLGYVYNGYEIDGNGEPWAYGENPPAQGAMFLNQKMSSFISHGDYNGFDPPYNALQYYYNMTGRWGNGVHLTYGGTGYSLEPDKVFTKYIYSGDPVAGTDWTELTPDGPGSTPNTPGDRRTVMSTGPFTFTPGETITIDIALPFAPNTTEGGPLASLAVLQEYAKNIQQYFDDYIVGVPDYTVNNSRLLVYPNPSNGQFTITSEWVIEQIEVYDLLGKKLFSDAPKTQTTQINTRLPQGMYIYRVVLQDHSVCAGKIVVR